MNIAAFLFLSSLYVLLSAFDLQAALRIRKETR